MPEVQVDRGAIRFVLGGAHIMCPGLTSPGGKMEEELPADTPVVGCVRGMRWSGMGCDESGGGGGDPLSSLGMDTYTNTFNTFNTHARTRAYWQAIRAEGKELELAIGITKMSTTDMYIYSATCFYVFLWAYVAVVVTLSLGAGGAGKL